MQDDISAYLDRITESNFLGRGARRPALLDYLLRMEATGEGDKLKAYSIGIDVFDKPAGFDPTTDSSVRVEVGRLRAAMALFEASAWADTTIMVDIPVGTYRPVITKRQMEDKSVATTVASAGSEPAKPGWQSRWQNLANIGKLALAALVLVAAGAVFALREDTSVSRYPIFLTVEDFEGDPMGKELSILIKNSFLNNSMVKLLSNNPTEVDERHFIVRGQIRKGGTTSFVSVELANQGNDAVSWSHFFQLDTSANIRDELDAKLNGELETRLIGETKVLLEKRDAATLTPKELFILATWVSGPAQGTLAWETERVTLMERALEIDPYFGPAHSVLADKYGFLANMHPDWDTNENLKKSQFHAERAIELSPLDSNAMFNVAQSYWHLGRHQESQRVFERVLELDSGHSLARFFARVVPFWCAQVPDDVMAWALEYDDRLSRDDPIRWIVLTWIATLHANRQEYDLGLQAAVEAAQIFQVGYTFMAHAMLLNKMQRPEEAGAVLLRQTRNWPGMSADHYARSTVPRLCLEQPAPRDFITDYTELSEAIAKTP